MGLNLIQKKYKILNKIKKIKKKYFDKKKEF